MSSEDDARAVQAAATRLLGEPAGWVEPNGYQNSLALCAIDSVFSLRARYSTVGRVLAAYRSHRRATNADPANDSLADLIETIDEVGGPISAADTLFRNRNKSPGTGRLKTEALDEAARRLVGVDVTTVADLLSAVADEADAPRLRTAWTGTKGLGSVSWDYLLMLAGEDGVKPDTMVRRFVTAAVGIPEVSTERASLAVRAAADGLSVSAKALDHAIWRYESEKARRRRRATAPDAR